MGIKGETHGRSAFFYALLQERSNYMRYSPIKLYDTTHINAVENREQWLAWRKKGIGGSESAAARGHGKFQSMLELYWDKINPTTRLKWINLGNFALWTDHGCLMHGGCFRFLQDIQ